MMLINLSTNTFHPIMYFEHPFPGGDQSEGNKRLVRYQSKGHHTAGFASREEAMKHVDELVPRIKSVGYDTVTVECDSNLEWDGMDIPADNQIRHREVKQS